VILEVPCIAAEQSRWTQRTTLEGRDYLLTFEWLQRGGHWLLSIADQDGVPIASGLWLLTNWPLLRGVRDPRRPPGELMVQDTLSRAEDPGFTDLGERFALAYYTADELA
jgi:hypothetical protein